MISCPLCKKAITYDKTSPHRPFCSERCKLIDLGHWASEKYTIPEETQIASIQPDEVD